MRCERAAMHVDRPGSDVVDHRVHLGAHLLAAEHEVTDQRAAPRAANSSGVPNHSASLGHTDAHIGFSRPRCGREHMSHFIIWSISAYVLRHAERAGEHAVRAADAARLECRLHDAVLGLLDRVGRAHLRAGRVLAVHAHHRRGLRGGGRSIRSRWIIERPRCVPHSMHACTHAWQPMQRLWSITKTGAVVDAVLTSVARAAS